jgi:small subunit ribosomal protein S1
MSEFSEVAEAIAPFEEAAASGVEIAEAGETVLAQVEPMVDASLQPEAVSEVVATAETAVSEPVAASAPVARTNGAGVEKQDDATDASGKRVVRTLAVGQEVKGTVKRISEFGAFVDIGVGRDGLVHVSELSVRRVGKVSDVLHEGQQVTLWIKKLDREKNRISLTMISPDTKTMRDLEKDDVVTGTVTRIVPYGAFIDLGVGRDALLHVREMSNRFVAKPEDVVKVGDQVEAKIIEIQRRRGRIDLSMKGLHPEPEPEPQPEPPPAPAQQYSQPQQRDQQYGQQQRDPQQRDSQPRGQQQRGQQQRDQQYGQPSRDQQHGQQQRDQQHVEPQQSDAADHFDEVEVLSPMELAFKKAMEESGVTLSFDKKKQGKKGQPHRRQNIREQQEEIFERTLKQGR